jgi:L-threonylcarbamoyladenylate synthase
VTERGPVADPSAVDAAAAHLAAGRAVVLPTDTVYGLAVLPSVPGATGSVFAIKGRPADVPLAVLVDSLDQARALVDEPPAPVARLVARYWPGPLTVVLARRAGAVVELGGDGETVGVRCPDHDVVRTLARRLGPLVVTSANRHGEPTPARADEVAAALGAAVAYVLDGGPCAGVASTVVDGTRDDLPVLRAGPISAEDVARAALP